MTISESNKKLRKLIDQVIEDGVISHAEYLSIMNNVREDGHIDAQEKALLRELQKMIAEKTIRLEG